MFSKRLVWGGLVALMLITSSTLASDNETSQQVLERAKYWDEHGRPDLAEQVRSQLHQPVSADKQKSIPVVNAYPEEISYTQVSGRVFPVRTDGGAAAVVTDSNVGTTPANTLTQDDVRPALQMNTRSVAALPEKSQIQPSSELSSQELLDRANYWDQHGRSDLADDLRSQLHQAAPVQREREVTRLARPEQSHSPVPTNVQRVGRDETLRAHNRLDDGGAATTTTERSVRAAPSIIQPARLAPATSDELRDQARYWEDRGRQDLSDQIRVKLESEESSMRTARQTMPTATRQNTVASPLNQDAGRSALENSLLNNPNSAPSRLDLAQIYRSSGEMDKARVQINSVLSMRPDAPDALYASAQLYADQRMWRETLDTLEKVSPASRNTEMGRLQKTAWAHVQIDRADNLVKLGKNAEAEVLLRRVAVELEVNYRQTPLAEPPPLWKTGQLPQKKNARH